MAGGRWRDFDAGCPEQAPENEPAAGFGSLREAAGWILPHEQKGQI
jgi:hypothetical protein